MHITLYSNGHEDQMRESTQRNGLPLRVQGRPAEDENFYMSRERLDLDSFHKVSHNFLCLRIIDLTMEKVAR